MNSLHIVAQRNMRVFSQHRQRSNRSQRTLPTFVKATICMIWPQSFEQVLNRSSLPNQ